jgi:rhodanese-related sulfurtransferase
VAGPEKAALFDGLAAAAKALSNGRRAELVDVLAQGERSVEALAGEIGQTVANTSQHLQVLARAGLVRSRRDRNRVVYRLASDSVAELWAAMRDVAVEHVAGLDRLTEAHLGDRRGLELVPREALARRLGDGVVVWDVRPAAEFEAGHIPGAVSVPPEAVRRQLQEVPAGAEVVTYCRGPFCVFADDAVRQLRRRGRHAARLEAGFPEWRLAGLPVAVGAE